MNASTHSCPLLLTQQRKPLEAMTAFLSPSSLSVTPGAVHPWGSVFSRPIGNSWGREMYLLHRIQLNFIFALGCFGIHIFGLPATELSTCNLGFQSKNSHNKAMQTDL